MHAMHPQQHRLRLYAVINALLLMTSLLYGTRGVAIQAVPTRAVDTSTPARHALVAAAPFSLFPSFRPHYYPCKADPTHPINTFETFPLNVSIFRAINNHRTVARDWFFTYYLWLGTGWVLLPVLFVTYRFRREKFWPLLLALAIETLVVTILKEVFHQPRPGSVFTDCTILQPLYQASFPSGDVAMGFTIAWSLLRHERRWLQVIYLGYAMILMYERIYAGVHFPFDVVTGAVFGIVSAMVAVPLLREITQIRKHSARY